MTPITRTFLKGLAALLPLTITVYAVVWMAISAERAMRVFIPDRFYVPGMGVVAGVVIVFAVGVLLQAWLIDKLFAAFEKLLERIPLIKSLYGSIKDLLSFFMADEKKAANNVVMVAMKHDPEMRLLGLLTRENFSDVPEGIGGEDDVAVYLPMSYQLGGFTVMIPRSRIQPIDMTTEQALRFAVTAGMTAGEPKAPGEAIK
jgi:uncharacterized membrane protein